MEALRTHVLDWQERHNKIQFVSRSPQATARSWPKSSKGSRRNSSPHVSPRRGIRLTESIVRDIRKAFAAGGQVSEIASRFNITTVTARAIRDRRTWADVE